MAKMLRTAEMIEALQSIDPDSAMRLRAALLEITDKAADILAEKLEIDRGAPADIWDGDAMVSFAPRRVGDTCPDALADYDVDGDWEKTQIPSPGMRS